MYASAVQAYKEIAQWLEAARESIFTDDCKARCAIHQVLCKCASFAVAGAGKAALTLTVAGSTCVAWSAEGLQLGICHPSFLVWLVFIMELKTLKPAIFVHECVVAFPSRLFEFFLNGIYKICVYTKVCPTSLGHPMRRPRQFVVGHLIGACNSFGTYQDFMAKVSRSMHPDMNANVYFIASDAQLVPLRRAKGKRRKVAQANASFEELLPPGQRVRLSGYAQLLQEKGKHGPGFVAELERNETVGGTPQPIVPTMLTHGTLWNFDLARPALASEKLMMQGVPTHQIKGVPFECPFQDVLTGLSEEDIDTLAGNGMSIAVVGTLLGYVLATTEMQSPQNSSTLNRGFSADCGLGGESSTLSFEEAVGGGSLPSIPTINFGGAFVATGVDEDIV